MGGGPGDATAGPGVVLLLVQTAWLAALLSAFGSGLFRAVVARHAFAGLPHPAAAEQDRRLMAILRASVGLAIPAGLVWLVLQSASMADAETLAQVGGAVTTVLVQTRFGHWLGMQIGLLLVGWRLLAGGHAPPRGRSLGAVALCGVAVALQARHLHAAALRTDHAWLLQAASATHLLTASGWLGGLLPLWCIVRAAPSVTGAAAARHFAPLGRLCVAGVALSALVQGVVLVRGPAALFDTGYGALVLAKLALFLVLCGFAWFNRYRLAPALRLDPTTLSRHRLARSIAWQTVFGLATVLAATILASLPPGDG